MDAIVTALHVYPVKSCRGIALERSAVGLRGLQNDRRWMIVDADTGMFITQRTEPRLALVAVALEEGDLVLRAPGARELRVPRALPADATRRSVIVWRDTVQALDCGPDAAQWVSDWLGFRAALVFMPDDVRRPAKPAYALPDDIVGFADGFPLLIASTSSLGDLNARIPSADAPLPMDRFRPNIVVSECPPWAEDTWKRIVVGDLPLRVVKGCARCIITTTDQETGARGTEPLKTLATFRQQANEVLFAQNAVPDRAGTVAVGDAVRVVEPAPQ
jgi:uncharacterized protein YcbX